MKTKVNPRFWSVVLLILIVTLSRAIPHMPNFSPMNSICLFAATYCLKEWQKYLIPILCIWLSDVYITNVIYGQYYDSFVWLYDGFYWQYATYAFIVLLGGIVITKVKVKRVLGAAILSSILFFIITNFGVWFSGNFYPKNVEGLVACYIAGIPFFKGTLLGDLFYSSLMFGVFELAQKRFPILKLSSNS